MIKSFRHKGLQELFFQGTGRKIHASLHRQALRPLGGTNATLVNGSGQLTAFRLRRSLTA